MAESGEIPSLLLPLGETPRLKMSRVKKLSSLAQKSYNQSWRRGGWLGLTHPTSSRFCPPVLVPSQDFK